jgi:hypothetical protein
LLLLQSIFTDQEVPFLGYPVFSIIDQEYEEGIQLKNLNHLLLILQNLFKYPNLSIESLSIFQHVQSLFLVKAYSISLYYQFRPL